MADFGTDISTFPDLDLTFTVISGGAQVLGEAIARRLLTPRGTFWWAPDYGIDVRGMLAGKADETSLDRWRAVIGAEIEKDERVHYAQVAFTLGADRLSATLTIAAVTADGPFRFVLGIDQVTVTLLEAAAAE